ncbi:hypothetical protein [Burkholderia guangdongensis]|uniref:hypothetical protein n=1 Tax=Burkholderia guangdongensis TaxID=1792500 RepID=UPI001FE3A7CA|nr:hypothetical protein [Burkholderia guangdongensis]
MPIASRRRLDALNAYCVRTAECSIHSTNQSSAIVRIRGSLPVHIMLSRRAVRRHNAISARAFVAVHTDEVASLLP